ncbi:S24 family peptidase [Achromobacter denitrificans]|uniref:S24 family peptidase n=1 Tax=Achromobacter denitrificans TaxID=32002 RepID=UPI003BA331D9
MLNGTDLGAAIKAAIDLKIASSAVASQAAIARHFNVKPPSIHDWIKKGSISKDKLPELWRYFSDVVGPDHWGLKSWPDMGSPAASESAGQRKAWPFRTISEEQVHDLPESQLSALEGAIQLAIAQMKLGIQVSPQTPIVPATVPIRSHKPGGLVDIDHADDAFPMRIKDLEPGPWEGGKTTKQMERESRGLRISQAINVGHVEDSGYSANDHEFVPVPELDVRMAAGKLGIENYQETEIGQILLRRSFLESFKRPIKRMKICYGNGFSMEPAIRHRNPMLVDIHPVELHEVQPRFVYAINRGGEMIVKCLEQWSDGTWMAISTNLDPKYHPFPLATDDGSEVRIVGTVLWSPYDLRNGVDERLLLGWRQAAG